jgi:hypothetical protein
MPGRARLLAGLAVVVAGGLAAGAGYALDAAVSDDSPTALASPTPSPTAVPSEAPTETPTPTPAAAPSPTTTPSPTGSATATPVVTSTPGTVRRYAYPAPTRKYAGLALTAELKPSDAPSRTVSLQGHATDGDGTVFVARIDWGDGTVDPGEATPTSCPAYPSPTAAPGPYQPAPDSRSFTRSHVYHASGDYTVVVTVRSVNADCRPHGPAPETATATFDGANAVHIG